MGRPPGRPPRVAMEALPPPTRIFENERHRIRDVTDYPDEQGTDRLHISKDLFPTGYDLQWVTSKVFGRPEPQLRATFERRGWVSVMAGEFDGIFDGKFMPEGYEGEIEVDGLVLMARPKVVSDEAEQIQHRRAREQVEIKDRQIRGGDLPNVTLDTRHETALRFNHVKRHVETISVPSDDEKA